MKKIITSTLIVLFIALLAACGKKTFTVTFNSAGGSTVAAVDVKKGETVAEPNPPTRAGYIFVEWQLDGTKYDFTTPVNSNITLVAVWDEVPIGSFVVSFNSNGGSYVAPQVVEEGKLATKPANPTREWFSFDGWYILGTDEEFDFTDPVVANIVIEARWKDAEYTQGNTYRTYLGNVPNMNPHFITLADASTLYSLMSDSLFIGDYDWDAMIDAGVVTEANRGDLTKVTFGTVYADASELPYNYFPSMATERPIDVNEDGTVWEIKLRNDLKFVDGTVINAQTFSDSYRLLLDPKLLNPRATNLYSGDSIPLKNAEGYFKQGADIDPEDEEAGQWPAMDWEEVGFEIVDNLTFRLELNVKKSQWHIMTWLASAITSVVHVENYEAGLIEDDTRTTYGTHANPHVSFGVYKLVEWVEEGYYVFQRNEENHRASQFRIPFVRYDVITAQSVAIQEFRAGRLDLANASGTYFADYEGNPNLKISPVTTFFRFAFGLTRDGGNPIIQDVDFRKAMYLAVDRTTFSADVRKPSEPTHGVLGSQYFSSEENAVNYRASAAGIKVLEDYAPDTDGYDPIEAKRLFDLAYDKLVTEGKITAGSKIVLEFAMADAETNHIMADWMAAQFAEVFGADKFEFKKNPVTSEELSGEGGIWDTGNFDVTFGGWQGMQFWAPGMLQVYSSGLGSAYILEAGFDTGNAIVSADLTNGKAAVEEWLAEFLLIDEEDRTEIQQDYVDVFEEFLDMFGEDDDAGIWTGTYDYLWDTVYYTVLDYGPYEGKADEMDNITAALEGELLRQMINIPLFTNVGVTIYSARVGFDANAFHARMGWGGLQYMYFR
ncbi:MAG: ABC transporter substrate-binding protein [Acholeplasmataceae bacterium]